MYVVWIDKEGKRHSVRCSDEITAKILYKEIKDFKYKSIGSQDYLSYKPNKYRFLAV